MAESLSIAVSGLQDAVLRVATAAQNIANSMSTGPLPTEKGGTTSAYTPQDVVSLSASVGDNNLGVTSAQAPRDPAYRAAFDPSSPDANADGLVAAPAVDIASELVDMQMASVTYAANAAVIKASIENDKHLFDAIS